ncbi:MAG TPA: hypothetical protein VIV60_13195 [Polyangiaceae bacterium]
MKPIVAIASMMLGTTSMATMVYMATNPNAFLSHTPRVHHRTDSLALVQSVSQDQSAAAVIPTTIEIAPIRISGRALTRAKVAPVKPVNEEPVLAACSDWRTLGPSASDSESVSGGHQVKLLCPSGANAQDTFLVGLESPESRKLR